MPAAARGRWPRWPRAASCRAWRWRLPSPPPASGAAQAAAVHADLRRDRCRRRRQRRRQVGRLMKQLGGSSQVLAVTHLAQVAACADHHFVVSKALQGKATVSDVAPVSGEARVSEVARMLGGESLSTPAARMRRRCWTVAEVPRGASARSATARCRSERCDGSAEAPMPPCRRRSTARGGADHRHLRLGQIGGAACAGRCRLLLRGQPAAGDAARVHPPGTRALHDTAWQWRSTCATPCRCRTGAADS